MAMASNAAERKGPGRARQFAKKLLVQAGTFISLAIVCFALWVVYRTLKKNLILRDYQFGRGTRVDPGIETRLRGVAGAYEDLGEELFQGLFRSRLRSQLPVRRGAQG